MLETKVFFAAIEELEKKGIAREITIQALKETFEQIFKKKGYDDCRVQVDILPEEGEINIYTIKSVVAADDVTDDALEIELEEALEVNPTCKIGDDLYQKVEIEDISKSDISKFKSILRQKMKEAEKAAVYEAYADKQGDLIPGVVEKIEPTFTCINIGRVTVVLPNAHKIGDEKFEIGQTVKVHLAQVNSATGGAQLHVSRADEGFLKRLFEEEIREVYDGTIKIVDIARQAGERSKVSVISNDENVDPVGSCIGNGGTKIKKICDQIGKEKIDIIKYHELPALFIAEALKPAQVLGVHIEEETKQATAIVRDGDLRVAIGKKGINVILAVRLTGWKIDIKEVSTALSEGIAYDSLETLEAKEEMYVIQKTRDKLIEEAKKQQENLESDIESVEEVEEVTSVIEETKEETVEEVKETTPVVEEKEVEAPKAKEPVKEEVKFEEQKVEIVNTARISLEELEAQIDADKKKQSQPAKNYKKKQEKVEEEKEEIVKKNPTNYMAVEYTEEELEEIESEEENNFDDDDVDYSEYDKFYED